MRAALKLVEKDEPVFWLNPNFSEYPIFLPVRNPETDSYLVKKSYLTEDGSEKYYVLEPGKLGLPTAEDFKILILLLSKAQKANSQELQIQSMNWLISQLKGNLNGRANYSKYKIRVLQALERWMTVRFKFVHTYYKEKSTLTSTDYRNVLEYGYDEESKDEAGKFLLDFHVRFHTFFWEANQKGSKRNLIHSVGISSKMKSDLSQRLYLYLYKWRYEMDRRPFERSFTNLVSLLGLKNVKNIQQPSVLIRKIDSAMKEVGPKLKITHHCYKKEKMVVFNLNLD